jgi:hypothetical protein
LITNHSVSLKESITYEWIVERLGMICNEIDKGDGSEGLFKYLSPRINQ